MRKILTILLLAQALFASDINSRLFEKIFTGIFPNKERIKIYTPGKNSYKFSSKIIVTNEIYKADLIFLHNNESIQLIHNKTFFVSSYKQLKNYPNAIGALYWKKGRPQIIFIEDRLKEQNVNIADYLKKYIE